MSYIIDWIKRFFLIDKSDTELIDKLASVGVLEGNNMAKKEVIKDKKLMKSIKDAYKHEHRLHEKEEKLHSKAHKDMKADEKVHEKIEKVHKKEDKEHKAKPKAKKGGKIEKVLKEFKKGKLHSGSKKGPEVTNRKQAVAIALSEARKKGEKVSPKKK